MLLGASLRSLRFQTQDMIDEKQSENGAMASWFVVYRTYSPSPFYERVIWVKVDHSFSVFAV